MNNNKPKKDVIGESTVMHVNKGFAIGVVAAFATILLVFGIAWGGVLVADFAFDVIINPAISANDPEAETIDVMAIMSPPTSESQAAKVYAEFPTLDVDGIKNAFGSAFEKFPARDSSFLKNLPAWVFDELLAAAGQSIKIVSKTVETYPADVEAWYNDHLPFRSIIFNTNEKFEGYIEADYGTLQVSIAERLSRAQYAYQILTNTVPNNGNQNPGSNPSGDPEDFEDLFGDSNGEISSENEESSSEETEETLPPLTVPEDEESSIEETIPEYENTEESEEETIPEYENTEDSEEETIPEFEDTEDPSVPNDCEHVLGEGVIVEQPTCTTWGVITYSCENCDYVKRAYTAKADHVIGEGVVEVNATCTEWGVVAYSCENCDYVKREYTAKADHVMDEGVVEVNASCTEWGVVAYSCENCEKVLKREYTAKADHVKDEGALERSPTCSEYGIMAYHCVVCNKLMDREYTKKLEHNYEAVNGGGAPICGSTYELVDVCSYCNDTRSHTKVKSHTEGDTIRTVEASYTTYGYTLVKCADCGGQYRKNLKNKPKDTSFTMPIYRSDKVMEGRYQWLFYRAENSEAYFCGTNLMSDAQLLEYATVMSQLNEICKARGITLQICIWPNKDQVYAEYVPLEVITQEKRVDRLVKYVRENTDVKIIYPIKELKDAKPYYDMYLKYDTHWNCAGGFVGYQAMLASLGLETTDIKNAPVFEYTGVETENVDPYYTNCWGDMMGLGGLSTSNYEKDHNYYVKYRPEVIVDTFTGANGAGDTRHTTAANAPNDLNFVMLADSYRVMQLGYLERDFTDCFLTHRSHVNDADVKQAIKDADILVIAAVERYDYDTLNTAKAIIKILNEE